MSQLDPWKQAADIIQKQMDDIRTQLEAVTRERDAKEREIQRLLNVVCASPACTATIVRRDDGSRVCAAGHPARWVNVDLLRTTERERDAARKSEARMRAAAREILSLARDTSGWCECNDGPMCIARANAAEKVTP